MAEEEMVAIGGHVGMHVFRGPNGITKQALHVKNNRGHDVYRANVKALMNEARLLRHLANSGIAPRLYECGDDWILQEDLGVSEKPQDMEANRRHLVRMVATMRQYGVRHGDLTGPNVIVHQDVPRAIDWQEGHLLGEVPPQKSPSTDSDFMGRYLAGTPGPDGNCDTPRVGRRWLAVLGSLGGTLLKKNPVTNLPLMGKTFMDLGCFQGDFVAMAATEGMGAWGLDPGGFRSGEDAIAIGQELWKDFPFGEVSLVHGDALRPDRRFQYDVVMMFSTWPYLVQQVGRGEAEALLGRILQDCGVLFFETQLWGDGPGPDFLKTDADVEAMLERFGTVDHLIRIPVTGRPAARSVWRVTPRA